MAQRRMFHADVVESDRFLDLPPGAQMLYFHLGMQADDDGFVNGPKQICRKLRRPPRELQALIHDGFLLSIDGIVVLKHFRIANNLKSDRIKPFMYPDVAKQLYIGPSKEYFLEPQPNYENLFLLRQSQMDSKRNPRREENKGEENNSEENSSEEESAEQWPVDSPDSLRIMGGTVGQGVILLSQTQTESLLDILGLDGFDHYVKKLADYIIKSGAKVGSHYKTILKWYREDQEVRT